MASLADITSESRVIIKIGAALAVVIFLLFILVKGYGFVSNRVSPEQPAGPEQKFGELPPIPFPKNVGQNPIEYRINTISGQLPSFAKYNGLTYVFEVDDPIPTLLALRQAEQRVGELGFTQDQKKISEVVYEWSGASSTITYDIVSHNFSVTSDLTQAQSSSIPQQQTIISDAMEILTTLGISTSEFDVEKTQIRYFNVTNGTKVPVNTQSQASIAEVNFVHKNIGELPVYYSKADGSIISLSLMWQSFRPKIVEADVVLHTVNTEKFSSYPLKTSQEALQELQNEIAYVINTDNLTQVDIKDLTLGYFLAAETEDYLQPVYLFSGNNFKAFVPAVKTTSVSN